MNVRFVKFIIVLANKPCLSVAILVNNNEVLAITILWSSVEVFLRAMVCFLLLVLFSVVLKKLFFTHLIFNDGLFRVF